MCVRVGATTCMASRRRWRSIRVREGRKAAWCAATVSRTNSSSAAVSGRSRSGRAISLAGGMPISRGTTRWCAHMRRTCSPYTAMCTGASQGHNRPRPECVSPGLPLCSRSLSLPFSTTSALNPLLSIHLTPPPSARSSCRSTCSSRSSSPPLRSPSPCPCPCLARSPAHTSS